jgi:hypothetical protein
MEEAQERYDQLRSEGKGQIETLRITSKDMSHGNHRDAMMVQSYIRP